MTDADIRMLLAVIVAAAGMVTITWIYACHRIPARSSRPDQPWNPSRGTMAVIPERSDEP
jgi:H+/Cl- antiporter ClcA